MTVPQATAGVRPTSRMAFDGLWAVPGDIRCFVTFSDIISHSCPGSEFRHHYLGAVAASPGPVGFPCELSRGLRFRSRALASSRRLIMARARSGVQDCKSVKDTFKARAAFVSITLNRLARITPACGVTLTSEPIKIPTAPNEGS